MGETEKFDLDSYIDSAAPPADELEGEVLDSDTSKETKDGEVKDTFINSSGEKETDGEAVVIKAQQEAGIREKENDEEEGTDIPVEFTQVALDQGWTEKEIIEFASDLDDETLLSLIPELLDKEDEKVSDSKPKEDSAKQETKEKLSKADTKTDSTDELAQLKKELKELKEELGKSKEDREVKQQRAMVQTINQSFDEAAEKFKIFGKTEELLTYPAGPKKGQFVPNTPEMIARGKVCDVAIPLIKSGWKAKDAMSVALDAYIGKNLEKEVRENTIKDLKKHEKKLSAKRSGKETVKAYEDEDERKEAVVREAARKAGIKGI